MKRSQLDGRHNYILTLVADHVGLDNSEVEDSMIEGNQVRHTCDKYRKQ